MSGSNFPIRHTFQRPEIRPEKDAPRPLGVKSQRRNRMAKFMYLFRSNPAAYRSMSAEQMQQTMKKWMDWKEALEKNGHIKQLGERLDGTGKVVRGKAKAVTDGPFVEVKDSIQGYMLLEANDMDQAVKLATDCPILDGDGTVEIRPFVSM
jgi:hypothetical protein